MTVSKNETISLDPTASADSRVVRAWIRLDDSAPVSGLVDLQVDIEIDTSGSDLRGASRHAGHGRVTAHALPCSRRLNPRLA